VILLAGHEAPDRDMIAPGVPALGQLAGSLAEAGYVTVRYDRRGSGQSGGRSESATMTDYADDVRVVAKWLADRKDVDSKRIAVLGHDEGAWVGLLAASRDGRISGIISLAAAATRGVDVALEQQQLQLDRMRVTPDVREARVTLQKQIHAAVLTGKGWEHIAPELKRQADTPFFQSFLLYDPAKVIDGIDAPILVLHGELDREVPVAHADKLAMLARDGDSKAVELVNVRGVNHLLLPAVTGETGEYPLLSDRTISKDVLASVVAWLDRTLPAARGR
jgi:pimeloyl-ACP methyl ester carboxylesterase